MKNTRRKSGRPTVSSPYLAKSESNELSNTRYVHRCNDGRITDIVRNSVFSCDVLWVLYLSGMPSAATQRINRSSGVMTTGHNFERNRLASRCDRRCGVVGSARLLQ
jgi:hypothetical protein